MWGLADTRGRWGIDGHTIAFLPRLTVCKKTTGDEITRDEWRLRSEGCVNPASRCSFEGKASMRAIRFALGSQGFICSFLFILFHFRIVATMATDEDGRTENCIRDLVCVRCCDGSQ